MGCTDKSDRNNERFVPSDTQICLVRVRVRSRQSRDNNHRTHRRFEHDNSTHERNDLDMHTLHDVFLMYSWCIPACIRYANQIDLPCAVLRGSNR